LACKTRSSVFSPARLYWHLFSARKRNSRISNVVTIRVENKKAQHACQQAWKQWLQMQQDLAHEYGLPAAACLPSQRVAFRY
ncbi:MAG: hypothetical protein ACXWQ7_16415, partial [Bdellovibrio sp.]